MMSRRKQKFPLHLRCGDEIVVAAADSSKRRIGFRFASDPLNSDIARKLRPTSSSLVRKRARILTKMKDNSSSAAESDSGNRSRNFLSKTAMKRKPTNRYQRLKHQDVNKKVGCKINPMREETHELTGKRFKFLATSCQASEKLDSTEHSPLTISQACAADDISESSTLNKSVKMSEPPEERVPSPLLTHGSAMSHQETTKKPLTERDQEFNSPPSTRDGCIVDKTTASITKSCADVAADDCFSAFAHVRSFSNLDVALSKQLGIDLKSPEHSILVRRSAGFRSNDHLLTKSTSESHVSAEDTKSDLDFSDESQPLDLSCRRDVLLDGKKLLPATVNGLLADEIGSIHYSMNISTPKSMCSHSLLEAVRDAKQVTCNTGSLMKVVKNGQTERSSKSSRPTSSVSSVPFLLPINSTFQLPVTSRLGLEASRAAGLKSTSDVAHFTRNKSTDNKNTCTIRKVPESMCEIESIGDSSSDGSTYSGKESSKILSSTDENDEGIIGDSVKISNFISRDCSDYFSDPNSLSISNAPGSINGSCSRQQRSPFDVERQNMENELREFEAKVFNYEQARLYLRDDSSALDVCAKLPLLNTGKEKKIFTVKEDSENDRQTTVTVHSEQVLSSRLLCIDHRSGCRRELYLCYLCNCAFTSATDLHRHVDQDHLTHYTCSLCGFTTHAPTLFSLHVHQQHIAPAKIHLNSLCRTSYSLPSSTSPCAEKSTLSIVDAIASIASAGTLNVEKTSSSLGERIVDLTSGGTLKGNSCIANFSSNELLLSPGKAASELGLTRHETTVSNNGTQRVTESIDTLLENNNNKNVDIDSSDLRFNSGTPSEISQESSRVGDVTDITESSCPGSTRKRTYSSAFGNRAGHSGRSFSDSGSFTQENISRAKLSAAFDSEKLPSRDGDELALDKSCRGSFKHEPEERRSPFLSPDDDSDVTVAQMLTALRRGSLTRQYFPENLTNVTTCNMLTRNGIITCRASSPVTNLQNFESLSSYAAGGHASKSLKKLSSPCIEIPNKYRELPDADKPISHSPPSLISASQCSDSQCSGSINYTESDYVSSSEGTGVFCIKTEVQDVVTAHDVLKLREENVIAGLVNGADVSKNLTAFAVLSQADTLPVTKTHAVNYPKLKLKNGAISANGKEKHASMEGENVFKMYQCRYCEKKFDRAFSCNRHERVHTGYKPCYCKHCGKGFSEPRNLRHHMIRFHSDGSMKHLIRRDRRRRLSGEYGMMPLSKPAGVLYSPGVFQNPVSSGFSFKNGIAENIAMKAFSDNGLKNFLQLIEPLQQKSLAMNDIVNSNVGDVKMQPCVQSLLGSNADTKPQQIFAKAGVNLLLKSQLPFATLLSDVPTSPVDLTRVTDLIRSDADTNYDSEYSLGYSSINSEANVCRQVPTSASDTVSEDDKLEAPTNQLCDGLDDDQPSIRDADIHVIDENEIQPSSPEDHTPNFSSASPKESSTSEGVREPLLLSLHCSETLSQDVSARDATLHNCNFCGYSARSASQLRVHQLRHKGVKEHSCAVCNYSGVTLSDLTRHKKTNSNVLRSANICACCGLGFPAPDQLQVHILKQHPELEGATSLLQMSLGQ
ncbi:uncharacterized protein LOC108669378 [Hyalella azteca]|uniref:Uncharacterized protein LOC108669378 n=1 Tax=Hyalella azteca TaxID=294128 RepID=A0A8B7NEZ0_HYAAZ|nr:uncharacterized protein LOC108669378 [Hyalella azteca]